MLHRHALQNSMFARRLYKVEGLELCTCSCLMWFCTDCRVLELVYLELLVVVLFRV